jgi:hypothetical protein
MRIAVPAWGSLLWDRRELTIAHHFKPSGPRLSLEFSRVSTDGCLTLVSDEDKGTPCETYAAESALSGGVMLSRTCADERASDDWAKRRTPCSAIPSPPAQLELG